MATPQVNIPDVEGCNQCKFHIEGECRRYPPAVMWSDIEECFQWANPPTPDDYYCGEFKQKYVD